MTQMSNEEIAQSSAKYLALAYERTGIQRPPPPDVETPADLLQCWESLSPCDRVILIKYARFLSAEDAPELFVRVIRDAASDIHEEMLVYERGRRQRGVAPHAETP
jgi:hypothetical protein